MVNLPEQGVEQHVHVVECVSHKKTILRIYFVATRSQCEYLWFPGDALSVRIHT